MRTRNPPLKKLDLDGYNQMEGVKAVANIFSKGGAVGINFYPMKGDKTPGPMIAFSDVRGHMIIFPRDRPEPWD